MIKYKVLAISNFLSVLITIIINTLANIIPFNGKYTGELSDQIPNLFVPAGLTFSIWGVIYLLLIGFGIKQLLDVYSIKEKNIEYINKIGYFFITASLANIVWVILWHYEQVFFSLLLMIVLLFSLIKIYINLNLNKIKIKFKENFFTLVPISVYLGWITVATVANITAVLVNLNVGEFFIGEFLWSIILIIITTILTLIILIKRKDIFFSIVIIWALLGIAIKRFSNDPIYGIQENISYISILMIIIISILIVKIIYSSINKEK